jgi:hypothetical protein
MFIPFNCNLILIIKTFARKFSTIGQNHWFLEAWNMKTMSKRSLDIYVYFFSQISYNDEDVGVVFLCTWAPRAGWAGRVGQGSQEASQNWFLIKIEKLENSLQLFNGKGLNQPFIENNSWCGVARRLAVRQAWVRFSAPQGGFSHWAFKRWGDGERPPRMVTDICIVWMWLNECMYVIKIWKIINKQKEWPHATKPLKIISFHSKKSPSSKWTNLTLG